MESFQNYSMSIGNSSLNRQFLIFVRITLFFCREKEDENEEITNLGWTEEVNFGVCFDEHHLES